MIAAERGETLGLRRLGDGTLLLWALAGLAGGIPAVVFGRLSWSAMAALNAGFAVASVALAAAVAAWRERHGRSFLFLSPSVRQTCLLLIPLGLAVQSAVIVWRPGTLADLDEAVRKVQEELEVNQDPALAAPLAVKAAVVERARDDARNAALPEQRSRLIEAGQEIAETPPDQPLPIPDDLEEAPDTNSQGQTGQSDTGTTGSASSRSMPGSAPPRSPLEILLRILTSPLSGLLKSLLGLGGGEEYRREAMQIVLDLHQGRQPSPAAVASMLAKLGPEDQKKARRFLQEFVEKQPGPGTVRPEAWRCASMEGQDLAEGASDTVVGLTRILCQSPQADCSQIEGAVLVGGEAFLSEEEKGRVLERLKEFRRDDCGLSSKPFRN